MKRKKINWKNGDIFVIKLQDETYSTGQVLDLQMKNVVRCALFDERSVTKPSVDQTCNPLNLISLISTTKEQLDFGAWEIIGNKCLEISKNNFPNEQFREHNWIGAKIYDASVVEEFLNAFYSLVPWDNWYDPTYLDKLLINSSKKPKKLIYLK